MAEQPNTRADLEWQLIEHPGVTLEHQIDEAMEGSDLETLLRELILTRRDGYDALTRYVRYGRLIVPKDASSRRQLVLQALWKLGFDLRNESSLGSFLRWHSEMTSMVESSELRTESDRENVRSVAVNFFVAVESVLDIALAFSAWALLNDHWSLPGPSRFIYNVQHARSFMKWLLDGKPYGDGKTLRLSDDGKNELFALQTGFSLLRRHLDELEEGGAIRPQGTLPSWADADTFRSFPFRHVNPWFDLNERARAQIVDVLQAIPVELSRGEVLKVRNRVPHAGGEFPSATEWRAALVSVGSVVGLLSESGLFPTIYTPVERVDDSYGRSYHLFTAGDNRLRVVSPSPVFGLGLPPKTIPQVILRSATLRHTNELLRFAVQQPSPFTAMWQGYPRRRGLALGEDDAVESSAG
jgi:hypothetical protein